MEERPFYNKKCFVAMVEEIKILEGMTTSVSTEEELALGEMAAATFRGRLMCRNRYCGTCDGVGCETAYWGEIPAFSKTLKRCVNIFYDEERRKEDEE